MQKLLKQPTWLNIRTITIFLQDMIFFKWICVKLDFQQKKVACLTITRFQKMRISIKHLHGGFEMGNCINNTPHDDIYYASVLDENKFLIYK